MDTISILLTVCFPGYGEEGVDENGDRRVRCLACSAHLKKDVVIKNKSRTGHEKSKAHERAVTRAKDTTMNVPGPIQHAAPATRAHLAVPPELLRVDTPAEDAESSLLVSNVFAGHYEIDGGLFDAGGQRVIFSAGDDAPVLDTRSLQHEIEALELCEHDIFAQPMEDSEVLHEQREGCCIRCVVCRKKS
jgi:hypothetical protein